MKVMTVLGIRPDFIRMSEVIRRLDAARNVDHVLVHTGQHYSHNMDGIFFEELKLRSPDSNLGVGSGSHAEQVGRGLIEVERVIVKVGPDLCLYLGDTNTAVTAISAAKCNVKVARVEGGMRSFDWRMPEEKNRVIVDHLADYLYAYTHRYKENLLLEGIPGHKVIVVGNPIVDIVALYRERAAQESTLLPRLGLAPGRFILVTLHREENIDNPDVLGELVRALAEVSFRLDMPVYYPMSYRTDKRLREFDLTLSDRVIVSEPVGFIDFLNAEAQAALIVTDSGTVQEEASILRVPCVVPRLSTERPETIECGGCVLAGNRAEDIVAASLEVVGRSRTWEHRLGDGRASERIVADLCAREAEIVDKRFYPPLVDRRRQDAYSPYINPLRVVGGVRPIGEPEPEGD